MARIDAYAYYLSTYGNIRPSRYDSHKTSDLREVYNHMVKINKESPLYKLLNDDAVAKYAIDIKENAKSIQNVVASLSDSYGSFTDSFRKKVAVSSNEESVSVTYIGDGSDVEQMEEFDIQINQVSSPQVNRGNYLKNKDISFPTGTYNFDLSINNSTYEFQYTIGKNETNLDVLKKIARLVNHSDLGIRASIRHGASAGADADTSALVLKSLQTGRVDTEKHIFEITSGTDADSKHSMQLLGIDQIAKEAKNSVFTVDGETFESASDSFTFRDAFELSWKHASPEGASAKISFKTDVDSVADNIMLLVNSFNSMLSVAENTSSDATGETNRLQKEISILSKRRRESLGNIGLMVQENGAISLDKEVLEHAIQPEHAEVTFGRLINLKNAIGEKANMVSLDPMHYVNKIMINYKNPSRTFAAPYFSSVYSGMMMDRYI